MQNATIWSKHKLTWKFFFLGRALSKASFLNKVLANYHPLFMQI